MAECTPSELGRNAPAIKAPGGSRGTPGVNTTPCTHRPKRCSFAKESLPPPSLRPISAADATRAGSLARGRHEFEVEGVRVELHFLHELRCGVVFRRHDRLENVDHRAVGGIVSLPLADHLRAGDLDAVGSREGFPRRCPPRRLKATSTACWPCHMSAACRRRKGIGRFTRGSPRRCRLGATSYPMTTSRRSSSFTGFARSTPATETSPDLPSCGSSTP